MRRLGWRLGTLVAVREETPTAKTLVLSVPDWPGHLPGQHVAVRLTAPDGYTAQRDYSIASAGLPAGAGDPVELTVQRLADGEVSPYLTGVLEVGQQVELRGPIGGYFVWRAEDPAPVQLVAGGSGIVPLMAMLRTRRSLASRTPFRLLYSVRTPADVYYADELRDLVRAADGVDVATLYTRKGPEGSSRAAARIGLADVNTHAWPAEFGPSVFVCGPTGFVETTADLLVALGHPADRVRTERFG